MEQLILNADDDYAQLDEYINSSKINNILLVCGKSVDKLNIYKYFLKLRERSGINVVRFSEFKPNPEYGSVISGIDVFQKNKCDMIIAVGGGSAMDVAKSIKLYSCKDNLKFFPGAAEHKSSTKLAVVPTTAGSGSEATKYAVIYLDGEKQSITDESCIPDAVIFDPSVLESLCTYQKMATAMDAFCHAIESYWSVNSTAESMELSSQAISIILENMNGYLDNDLAGNAKMQEAAYIAGRAINITQTTACHAMSYKLTSKFGISHGHAALLCLTELFPYTAENTDKCIDPRGKTHLETVIDKITKAMGCNSYKEAIVKLKEMASHLNFEFPTVTKDDFDELKRSVNPMRLKNHPIRLDVDSIELLYNNILKNEVNKK